MTGEAHYPFLSARAKAQYLAFNETRAERWPVPSENRTVETSYGHTFMRISGPAGAPPLVLLPGGRTHSLMWIPNIAALAGRYRTYALDSIYDVGRSAGTRPLKSVDDLTRWLGALFDALGLASGLGLMGLSYGGWLAANFAGRFPGRVEKLVLLAPAGWILPLRPAMLLNMMQVMLYPKRYFIRRSYLWSMADLAASGAAGRKIIDDMTEDLALAFSCFGDRWMTKMVAPTVADDETLRSLKVPTLLVVGGKERIYSCKKAMARLARVAPGVARAVIPGAGHDMTWLKPELVNSTVLDFLAGP